MKNLKSVGRYGIYLTGSRMTITRTVKTDGEKCFVIWGGNLIEVKRGVSRYYTVEPY